jgi:malonyl-CoA/methylmalonyl-CoA synthetase
MSAVARGHPRAREGLTATNRGVDFVVVGPSYGRLLPAVSEKISWHQVKLFAQNNVARVVWRANRCVAPAPGQARLTHSPSFGMQSTGCAANGLFASEKPDQYDRCGDHERRSRQSERCMTAQQKTPANANLFSRLFEGLDDPKRLAIETLDGKHISYSDLIARAGQLANVLLDRGVKVGDRVAAQTEKSVTGLVLYLATVRAGAVYLPLNTAYTLNELEYFITDAEPSLVVCDPSKADGIRAIAAKVGARVETLGPDGTGSLTDAADKAPSTFATVPRQNDDLAAILYTSGTTGRSKGAMLTHDNLASNSLTLVDYWGFSDKDVLIHALPIYHTHGLFVASNVTLFARAAMIFLPKFDPEAIIKLMARSTVMMGVPTFYTRLLQNPALNKDSTKHMRLFVSGSAPLLADTHREWFARTGHAVLERYGMTETNMNTSNPYDGERVAGAVGHALPGVSVRVTDPETGKILAPEEIGMIEVKGPNVFKGYWRMPEKTKAEFRGDGFFITGDIGKIDTKDYVHILGRGKDLVISGGFNVYPKEIESEIDAMPGVVESAVIGVPHADFGEGVTAVVVCDKNADVSEASVLKALDGRLAKFKMPKRVFVVDELPRNAMGKVQKNILRETYKNIYASK